MKEQYFQTFLNNTLADRMNRNPYYSLRSFAKALDIDPGTLSTILRGKRILSLKMAKRIVEQLDLSPVERESFIYSVIGAQKKRTLKRQDPEIRNISYKDQNLDKMNMDLFKIVSDWKYSAIVEMARLPDFQFEKNWIAKQLSITSYEANLIMKRLKALGLLTETEEGFKASYHYMYYYGREKTSSALKRAQKLIREKAIQSIEKDPIETRSMTSVIVAANSSRIEEAKLKIEKFNKEIAEFLSAGTPDCVYALEVGLFPLQDRGNVGKGAR